MLTKDEQFQIALEVMERMSPELPPRTRSRYSNILPSENENNYSDHNIEPIKENKLRIPSLREIVYKLKPLPPYSALIGMCEDGLPFLFDLSDPTPGSILITGETNTGKSQLLKTILTSASSLNRTDQVRFCLINPNLGEYSSLTRLAHCMEAISTHDRASSELVIELAKIAEQRKSGRHIGPAIILAIDYLEALLSYKEFEVYNYLKWLIKHGPDSMIWTIAILRPGQISSQDNRVIKEFKTHLIGRNTSNRLPAHTKPHSINPVASGHFETYMDNEWVRFWIPGAA